jgi:hypothetical protein
MVVTMLLRALRAFGKGLREGSVAFVVLVLLTLMRIGGTMCMELATRFCATMI